METCFDLADDLGPTKIVHVHEPSLQLRGILVVDNAAQGGTGGHRDPGSLGEPGLRWSSPWMPASC
jgi:hypothetical protein